MQLRGFGMTMDMELGTMRSWVVGGDGVKRWADTNQPVESIVKTCMNCGTSGCDHKDARRCASSGSHSLWTPNALGQEPCAAVCARSPAPQS